MVHPGSEIPVTVIVLTLNEAVNIETCLSCLDGIDDIVIVDSGSMDRTLEIARSKRPDARIFSHEFRDFGDQRNWAVDNTSPKHQWVLFVDADEYCTPELFREIAAFVGTPGDHVGGFIAGKNFFLGRWLKYSTLFPSYQLRLLKVGQVRFRKEGHGQKEVASDPLCYLKEHWRHEAVSKGIRQWIDRHNEYSTEEVELIMRLRAEPTSWMELGALDPISRRRALKRLGAKLPLRPLMRFVYVYICKRGFLDGYAGLIYCLLRVAHDIHIMAKIAEYKRLKSVGEL